MADSLCRLCSSTEQIVNVFHSHLENGEQLRLCILLATGIQIKETDTISKMVCRQCCEIAVKLHKYRTMAVANDKLLQEKDGVPYTPPITNQEELMRVASEMSNQNVVKGTTSQDALELLNVSIKTEPHTSPITNQEELMHLASGMSNENVVKGTTSQDALELLNVSIKTKPHTSPIANQEELMRVASEMSNENVVKGTTSQDALELLNVSIKTEPHTSPITNQEELMRVASEMSNENVVKGTTSQDALELLNVSIKTEPHTTPITNQDELMRIASGMSNENVVNGNTSQDALELLNVSIKTEVTLEPCVTSTSSSLTSPEQLVNTVLCDQPNSDQSCFPLPHNKSVEVHTAEVPNTKDNGALNRPQLIEPQVSTSMNSRFASKRSYVHHSIKKILTENKNVILPAKIVNSDMSPVVSLDSNDVSNWYAAHLNIIKQTLSDIAHDSLYFQINTPSSKSSQDNSESDAHIAIDSLNESSEDIIKNSSKSATPKIRNCRRILDSSDSESDSIGTGESYTKETHTAVQGLHKPMYTAKKRSSRKPHSTRKKSSRQSDTIEVIPQKKKRIYCDKDVVIPLNKINLPPQRPSDKHVQKEILTSFLEPTLIKPLPELVDSQNILATGKALDIFMCPVCSLPCTSKKQLLVHQKIHLKCKNCQTTTKTIELMKKHLNESCFIRQVKDNAVVKLTRVDSLQSVVQEYPEAFQEFDISKPSVSLYCNENINSFEEHGINITDIERTTERGDVTSTARAEKNNEEDGIITEVKVYISDDEVEYNDIPHHNIVEQPVNQVSTSVFLQQFIKNAPDSTPTLESISKRGFPALKLTETEVIRSLFKKYANSTKKCNKSVQTFTRLNDNIKYTRTNVITLENVFSELLSYKIPVRLESRPIMSAWFEEGLPTTATSTIESWVHKTPMDLIKLEPCTINSALPPPDPAGKYKYSKRNSGT